MASNNRSQHGPAPERLQAQHVRSIVASICLTPHTRYLRAVTTDATLWRLHLADTVADFVNAIPLNVEHGNWCEVKP